MPNTKTIADLSARLKAILDADVRLDDNLSSTPTVFDQTPSPIVGSVGYAIWVDPVAGESILADEQARTAMSFLTYEHTFKLWLAVYNDDADIARADYWKLEENVLQILADSVEDSGYWYAGLPILRRHSDSHLNLDYAGDYRYRVGSISFRFVQDKTL